MTMSIPEDFDRPAPTSPCEPPKTDQKVLDLDDHFLRSADCCWVRGQIIVGRINPETNEPEILVFCGHHWKHHEVRLSIDGYDTLDADTDWKWVLK